MARILKDFIIFSTWRTPDQSLSKYLSYPHFHEWSRANLPIFHQVFRRLILLLSRARRFSMNVRVRKGHKAKALFVYGQWSGRYGYPPYLWLDKNFVFMWIQDVYPPIPTLSNLDLYFMYSIQNYYLFIWRSDCSSYNHWKDLPLLARRPFVVSSMVRDLPF